VQIQLRYTVEALGIERALKELSRIEPITIGAQATICAKALLASLNRLVDATEWIAFGVRRILLGLYNHFLTATCSHPTRVLVPLPQLDSSLQRCV